jgi:AAA15 family ATPase/GTPase
MYGLLSIYEESFSFSIKRQQLGLRFPSRKNFILEKKSISMKVKLLEIEDLKSFNYAKLEFSPSINLLIGENNSGKTTIIQALMNLQYESLGKKDIRINETQLKTVIRLTDIGDEYRFALKDFISSSNTKEIDICWILKLNKDGKVLPEFFFVDSRYDYWNLNESKSKNKFDKTVKMAKGYFKFPDIETKSNFIFPFLAKRKTEYYDPIIKHDEFFKIQEGMRNIATRIQRLENPSHPKHDQFNTLCNDILGFRVGIIPVDQQIGNGFEPGIYVSSKDMIQVRSMGEGVINILGFIVTLLTEDNKLFLIEELENDIHPKALKKLLNLIILKSENNQFVISTHSNIILKYLGGLPESKIIFTDLNFTGESLKLPTTNLRIIKNDPNSRMQVLEKLGYDFNDFDLYDGYLLLEESSAESIIKDILIPYFTPNLYGRLKTIAAKGVNDLETRFSDFHRLFVFVHTKPIYLKRAWVIADGDEAGKRSISSLVKAFPSWNKNHFLNFTKNNIEDYYPQRFEQDVKQISLLKGEDKRQAKSKLIGEVIKWSIENREKSKNEFKKSASEIISILKTIEKRLNKF